jgi:hypothetical protein
MTWWSKRRGAISETDSFEPSGQIDVKYTTYFDFPDFYQAEGRGFEPPRARHFFPIKSRVSEKWAGCRMFQFACGLARAD